MILNIGINEKNNNNFIKKEFKQSINFNNQDDKFQLSQYQKELEQLLINKIIDDVLIYLSNI